MSIIHVFVEMTAHPGQRQNILDVLVPNLGRVKDIPGCIEYTVAVDTDVVGPMHTQTKFGPDTFVIIEKWASLADLSAHSTAPGIDEYFATIGPFLKSRVTYFLKSSQ